MPWLDLGELPVSYNTNKTEAFQVYMIPQDELPYNMVLTYDNWRVSFDLKKAAQTFPKTSLSTRGVTLEDV